MKSPQSALAFLVAALLCIAALITRIVGSPLFIPVMLIIVAAIALVAGIWLRTKTTIDQPVVFSVDQVEQLRVLKESGQEGAAIRQAQLWSRGATNESVVEAVRKL